MFRTMFEDESSLQAEPSEHSAAVAQVDQKRSSPTACLLEGTGLVSLLGGAESLQVEISTAATLDQRQQNEILKKPPLHFCPREQGGKEDQANAGTRRLDKHLLQMELCSFGQAETHSD